MTNPTDEQRRLFLATMTRLGLSAAAGPLVWRVLETQAAGRSARPVAVDAEYFTPHPGGSVTCALCPHHEILDPGETGLCRVRTNERGKLKTFASGQPCVINVDPIEKNPLSHALPGRKVLTLAHAGCNMRCQYCQNWEFSQRSPTQTRNYQFDQSTAFATARKRDLAGITFTYTEGTSHIEFNKRLAKAAQAAGFRAFLCTNGYVERQPLADFLQHLDGVTVTIKAFTDKFYRDYLGALHVKPVLDACEQIKAAGKWLEVATLVVPTLNDSDDELKRIAGWMVERLGPYTPWHIERFVPEFKMRTLPRTPVARLEKALAIGRGEGLKFVYLSNFAPHESNHTYCPKCGRPVIKRLGFQVLRNDLVDGRCPACRAKVPGLWG